MGVVKKFNDLLDLEEIDVLIDETGESRHIIISDLPESVPQGRSSFLVETSPYMKEGTELQMDFIDSEGESIYLEPVSDYLEGSARRVSMEVYDDVAAGVATLIIVGELESVPDGPSIFSDSVPVPEEFEGHYNVRLTKQVIINTTSVNTQPIKFFTQPKIKVFETRKGTMVRTEVVGSVTSSKFNVEGIPTDQNLLFQPYGEIDEELTQGSLSDDGQEAPKPSKKKNVQAYVESKKVKNKKGLRKNTAQKRSGIVTKKNSPISFPYQLRIGNFDGEETFRFNTKHIGGTVHFHTSSAAGNFSGANLFENSNFYPTEALNLVGLSETPTFDTSKEIGLDNQFPTHYTASIVDLVNSETALVELPFTNKNEAGDNIILPIFGQGEIFFEALPTGSYSGNNLISYADVRLSLMRTFSGDVYKVKVYAKSEGGFDDYSLLAEVPLEGKELLVDDASVGMGERIGYVVKQSEIDTYWTVSGSVNGLVGGATVSDASLTASYNNDVLLDAIRLSGSNSDNSHHVRFQLKDDYRFDMKPGIDYTLSANIVGNVGSSNGGLLMVYVSGSSMYQQSDLHHNRFTNSDIEEPNAYGKRLGILEVDSADEAQTDFGLVTSNFTPNVSGSGILQFRVVSGKWYISDISIQPASDTGFSPNFFEFKQEMPSHLQQKRPDKFEFLVEFYDINNNISDTVVYSPPIPFDGTNLTITGADNNLSGDMFIGGESTSSGIHIGGVDSTLPETGEAGAEGSGFLRSVGYMGFTSASSSPISGSPGFMFFSGSVLPNSGDDYKGIGFEIAGPSGSFRFRTDPNIFEVKADSFFVGKKAENSSTGIGQFISGSTGNIEISSSLFHLDPGFNSGAGRLIIGAGTTINADLSVNQLFTPAQIDGEQSTILNASSSITSDGLAKFVSASLGGWDVDETAIKSPGGNLQLQSNNKRLSVFDTAGTPVERIRIGEVDGGTVHGIKIFDGTGTADSDILVELGEGGNTISGWTVGPDTIQGGNLILGKEGFIQSADYVSDLSGFIITAALNGYAEFENCRIRGTLATTTFEKESVNAVGGQLFVANSSAISGSEAASTEVSMSLVNVSGFTRDEIVLIKKVSDTGFNTEYVKVISSSRFTGGGDNDPDGLAGHLFVQRGHGFYKRTPSHGEGNPGINYYGDPAANGFTYQNQTSGQLRLLKHHTTPVSAYANGTGSFNVSGSHVSSGSFHVHLSGSVTQIGDGTSLSLRLLNGSDSDSVIGTKPFWLAADGTGRIDRDLYFDSLNATGSKIKIGVLGVTDDTDDAQLRFEAVTASLDYGIIASVQLGISGSVGDPIGGPQEYKDGQVVVSTGKYFSGTGSDTVGSGYIRLNANPNNVATPYMDIIERTGSGIYDVDLKVRLGDLSGLGVDKVGSKPRFGIFTENAFFTNKVVVGTLATEHIKIDGTSMLFKDGSNTQAELRGTTWTLGGAHGTTDDCIVLTPDAGVTIFDSATDKLVINSDGMTLTENNQIRAIFGATTVIGSSGAAVATDSTDDCIRIAAGTISIFEDNTNKVVLNSSTLTFTSDNQVTTILGATSVFGCESAGVTTTSTDNCVRIADGTISIFQDNTHKAVIDNNGLSVFEGSATVPEAIFGSTTTIGRVADSSTRVQIESDNVKIINRNGSSSDTTVIEFNSAGTITAADYLIEKSRLFGFGADGTISLASGDCTVSDGGNGVGTKVSSTSIKDANGDVVCSRSGTTWTMQGDWYTYDFTVGSGVTLKTNGFRLFVFGTLTNQQTIENNASGKTGGAGGSLSAGTDGGNKGTAASAPSGGSKGGNGGDGGGSGGIVFISARNIANSGTITANGADGSGGGAGTSASTGNDGGAEATEAGGGGSTSATTRIDVVDPHIVQMMRDVMHTTETAPRLKVAGGSGGGGAGGTSGGSAGTGNAGVGGSTGTAVSNCIITADGAAGGKGGAGGSNGGGGGGGGGGGAGGVVVIISTTPGTKTNDFTFSAPGTINANKGDGGAVGAAGGLAASAGTVGSDGPNGKVVYIQV